MNIKFISRIVLVILWLSTFAAALIWAFVKNPPFEPEPVTVLLGLISGAVTGLLNEFAHRLEQEEFSTSYALAYGYVNNFLEPAITALLKKENSKIRFYIYLPERLNELEPKHVERMILKMREKNFSSQTISLEFNEGRPRDILMVSKNTDGAIYLDFPTTLLTLNSYVDYKIESKSGSFSEVDKVTLGKMFILKFREAILKMIELKGLNEYILFTDKSLNF
ncbi:MAG TPA: hypothetical protein DGG95_03760 [Cytophagales bacterium]|jgi:hypothetical protein|nr:hypothetical protein [Cytophagales bacterium]